MSLRRSFARLPSWLTNKCGRIDPEECTGTSISAFLAAEDMHVFRDATDRLQEDDSHTLEVRFRMQVCIDQYNAGGPLMYREMVGKGMLMLDRGDGTPSHTMWVLRPVGEPEIAPPESALETGEIGDEPGNMTGLDMSDIGLGIAFPLNRPISTTGILCRICELQIPEWYFEKHTETCHEVHKLEADIGDCNESISEVRKLIREVASQLENPVPQQVIEYRSSPVYVGSGGSSSPLQVFRPALPKQFQKPNHRKVHLRVIESLDEILQVLLDVGTPSLREDQAREPIERQRLLSPSSDRRIQQLRLWPKPATEDAGISRMVLDVDLLIRSKLENVARMQNTLRYSEKVRQEWEERVEQTLANLEREEREDMEREAEEEAEAAAAEEQGTRDDESKDDQDPECPPSSTTSEYDFGGREPSSQSTAASSTAPGQQPTSSLLRKASTTSIGGTPSVPIPLVPATYAGVGSRSSTPSSMSSPLARAIPIVASTDLGAVAVAVMTDKLSLVPPSASGNMHRQVASVSNIDASKVTVTPPLSPMLSPKDGLKESGLTTLTGSTSGASLSRRHSMGLHATMHSPVQGPLSPRIPVIAPASRAQPSSIKDFEIIKPISKGAFGSVFLAKKKTTGDYFAIKVLKKADMIAKNQITNVKAERMILMRQAESPFVVKLFFTFQSKDNLYLVMEYLNGGDCAALIKSLGALPEEWTKNYVAEVVLGLEYLHERGVVHRCVAAANVSRVGADPYT